jgi:hypothetical protein
MNTCERKLIQNLQLHNFIPFKRSFLNASNSSYKLTLVSIKSTKLEGDLKPILGSFDQFLFLRSICPNFLIINDIS